VSKSYLVKIEEVKPHDNADKLEFCRVLGWWCITRKGQFNVGDEVVYIEVDSILAQKLLDTVFEGTKIKPDKGRIRAVKIRGMISQGLLISTDLVGSNAMSIGDSCDEVLGITKYEPPEQISFSQNLDHKKYKREYKAKAIPRYVDTVRIEKAPNIFNDEDEVHATAKLHGCLAAKTMIRMFDGSKKTIKEIVENKIQAIVAGVDDFGKVVPSRILGWFDNGKTNNWLNVIIESRECKNGNGFSAIMCTPNHKFLTENGYVEASNLKPGDLCLNSRYGDFDLNDNQRQPTKRVIALVSGRVFSITPSKNNAHKYDIETETHNFMANNVVVHNSSARYGHSDLEPNGWWPTVKLFFRKLFGFGTKDFICGTRNVDIGTPQLYHDCAEKFDLKNKIPDGYVLYGEIVGNGIQKNYDYGFNTDKDKFGFFAYALKKDGKYVDYDEFASFCKEKNINTVPLLLRGLWKNVKPKLDAMLSFDDYPTDVETYKIPCREGIVIGTITEGSSPQTGERKIVKYINPEYLLKPDNSDFH
jgi:tRNA-binding EMAP/Myf-like protein